MNFKLSYITDLVALRIGEFPDWRRRRSDPCRGVCLDQLVETLLPSVALHLTAESPLDRLGEGTDFRLDLAREMNVSYPPAATFLLPDNFLRLKILLFPDWPHPLSDDFPADPQRLALGDSAPDWLTGRLRRPAMQILPQGGRSLLRFFPAPATNTLPTAAVYIPRPVYDPDTQTLNDFDTALLSPLADSIAATLGNN